MKPYIPANLSHNRVSLQSMQDNIEQHRKFVQKMKRWSAVLFVLALVCFTLAVFASADAMHPHNTGFAVNDRGYWLVNNTRDMLSEAPQHRVGMLEKEREVEWGEHALGDCLAIESFDDERIVAYFGDRALILSRNGSDAELSVENKPYMTILHGSPAAGLGAVDLSEWNARAKQIAEAKNAISADQAEAAAPQDPADAEESTDASQTESAATNAEDAQDVDKTEAEADTVSEADPEPALESSDEADNSGAAAPPARSSISRRVLSAWIADGKLYLRMAGEAEIKRYGVPVELPDGRVQLRDLSSEGNHTHIQLMITREPKEDAKGQPKSSLGTLYNLSFQVSVVARDSMKSFMDALDAAEQAQAEAKQAAESQASSDQPAETEGSDASPETSGPTEANEAAAESTAPTPEDSAEKPKDEAPEGDSNSDAANAQPESTPEAKVAKSAAFSEALGKGDWFIVPHTLTLEKLAEDVDLARTLSDGEALLVFYRAGESERGKGETRFSRIAGGEVQASSLSVGALSIWRNANIGSKTSLIALHGGELYALDLSGAAEALVRKAPINEKGLGKWSDVGSYPLHMGFTLLSRFSLYVIAALLFCGAVFTFVLVASNRTPPSEQTMATLTKVLKQRAESPGKPISLRDLGVPIWANLNVRMIAFLIDFLAVAPAVFVLSTFTDIDVESALNLFPLSSEYLLEGMQDRLAALALIGIYGFICEAIFGRTLGKMVMGIRVVRYDQEPASEWRIFIRNALRTLELCHVTTIFITIICVMVTRRNQRLGDLLSGSALILEARKDEENDGDESPF